MPGARRDGHDIGQARDGNRHVGTPSAASQPAVATGAPRPHLAVSRRRERVSRARRDRHGVRQNHRANVPGGRRAVPQLARVIPPDRPHGSVRQEDDAVIVPRACATNGSHAGRQREEAEDGEASDQHLSQQGRRPQSCSGCHDGIRDQGRRRREERKVPKGYEDSRHARAPQSSARRRALSRYIALAYGQLASSGGQCRNSFGVGMFDSWAQVMSAEYSRSFSTSRSANVWALTSANAAFRPASIIASATPLATPPAAPVSALKPRPLQVHCSPLNAVARLYCAAFSPAPQPAAAVNDPIADRSAERAERPGQECVGEIHAPDTPAFAHLVHHVRSHPE